MIEGYGGHRQLGRQEDQVLKTLAVQQADIGGALTDMWRSVLLFVPKAAAFAAILAVGYLAAKVIYKLVDKGLDRVGFDRAVERGGIGRALERSRYDASDICAKLAYYAVLLFTLQFAFGVWGPNPISDLISALVAWLPRAFVAIVIVVVSAAIASAVRDLVQGALGGLSYGQLLARIASTFILGLGVIAALNQVGIATAVTTPVLVAVLATVAGVVIVGVGGGLIRPMQQRWDGWLDRVAVESQVIRDRAQAYAQGRDDVLRQMADRTTVLPPVTEAATSGHALVGAGRPGADHAATVGSAGASATGGAPGGAAAPTGAGRPVGPDASTATYRSQAADAAPPSAVEETQRIDPRDIR